MLQTIGNHSERQGLYSRHCLIPGGPIRNYPGQVNDLCDPSAVCLLFDLDSEDHIR